MGVNVPLYPEDLAGTHLFTRLYGITFQTTVMLLQSRNNGHDAVRTVMLLLDVT
jgi:hypothetical protein